MLDDPLSAVDAHVGEKLFNNAICGSLKSKTRVLVTHALHFLPRVDYIICIEHGKVTQQGTYAELLADTEGAFSNLVREFGSGEETKNVEEEEKEKDVIEDDKVDDSEAVVVKKSVPLHQEEERATGAVTLAG